MKRLASPVSVAAACGLIVVTNLALLASAGWNRRGEPLAELMLTERELAMPEARQDDGTGWELSLVTTDHPPGLMRRTARSRSRQLPRVAFDWLDGDKLRELGFRTDLDPADPAAEEHYSGAIPRRVYLVVEYNGEAWEHWIRGREEQVRKLGGGADEEAVLALDRTTRSRLFPVDAGLDADLLQDRYGNREGHAVVAALIQPKIVRQENRELTLSGNVNGLVVRNVHVPSRLRRSFESFLSEETWEALETREQNEAASGWPAPSAPRYRATLAVGRRHEPWLVGVTTLEHVD